MLPKKQPLTAKLPIYPTNIQLSKFKACLKFHYFSRQIASPVVTSNATLSMGGATIIPENHNQG